VEYGRVAQFEATATAKVVLAGEESLTRAAYFFGLGDEMQTVPLEPGTPAYFAALPSIYAPVSFPPAPVLALKPTEDGRAHPLPLMMD
jgi:hypothetical protein